MTETTWQVVVIPPSGDTHYFKAVPNTLTRAPAKAWHGPETQAHEIAARLREPGAVACYVTPWIGIHHATP